MSAFIPEVKLSKEDFIVTSTGNIISKVACLCRPQSIEMPSGKCVILPNALVRGDLAQIKLEKYCIIGEDSVIRPSYGITGDNNTFRYIPISIGSYTSIGRNCIIECAVIGLGCTIGNNCILSKRCIIKDHVIISNDTIVPPDMVIPPFAIVEGAPARIVGFTAESASTSGRNIGIMRYKSILVE